MCKNVTEVTFKKLETQILWIGFNYGNNSTATENCVRHLDTKIIIALAQTKMSNQELKQNKHFTQMIVIYN